MTENKAEIVRGIFLISVAVAAALALLLLPGAAQGQDAESGNDVVEEIVVTGSRLLRRDFTAPSPLVSIDREQLLNSGQPTIEDTLNQLPQVQPSIGRSTNNGGDGGSSIDLRGIGAGRTLVMLNGRRIAPTGIGSAVNVNTLPAVLIDRIEVITGGATTVYGSDAIAGVVNFITRDDFGGFGVESSFYTTADSDSDIFDVNLTWGHNFDAGNVTLFGTYLDREALLFSDRAFSAQTFSDDWFSAAVEPGGSTTTPAGSISFPRIDFGNGPARTTWDANGDPREFVSPDDLYDFAPLNYLQTPLERFSVGSLFNYDIGNRSELYGELAFTHTESTLRLAPSGTFGAFVAVNTDNPVLSPANQQFLADNAISLGPNLVGFALNRRFTELGPRVINVDKDYTRLLTGLRGELTASWDYDIWVSYTKGEEEERSLNDTRLSRLQQGLLVDLATGACIDPSNGCVPLNIFGADNLSQAGIDYLRVPPYLSFIDREQTLISAFIRGAPFELPAGEVATAIGVEWRKDEGRFTADEALFSGDTLGFRADSNVVGEESVAEIYAEALVPLLADVPVVRYLGLEVGGRLSEYDNAGRLETWKLGADWELLSGLRVRTMFQRSARAPNLGEAFQLPFTEDGFAVFIDSREDPCSASADPVGNGLRDVCIAQGIPDSEIGVFEAALQSPVLYTIGGNANLEPEIAETFTAGVVLSIFDSWTLAVDYFDLDVEDTIGQSDPMFVCWDAANTDRVTCDRIQRDPTTFDINAIDTTNANLGKLRTKGFDTQFRYTTELTGWLAAGTGSADLKVSIVWTHVNENSVQGDPASTIFECVGKFGFTCDAFGNDAVYPENRITSTLSWRAADVRAQLTWRWIDGTDNSARDVAPVFGIPVEFITPGIEAIDSKSYFDLSVNYDVTENLTLGLTIANLLDEDPAFMADNGSAANTDTEMYDVFGRAYTLRLALNY